MIPVCRFEIEEVQGQRGMWSVYIGTGKTEVLCMGTCSQLRGCYKGARTWAKKCLSPRVRKRVLDAIDATAQEAIHRSKV